MRIIRRESNGCDRSQSVLQWAEPWLKVAPLVEAFTVNRTTNLLGTDGADAAGCVVKFEASGFEGEAAEFEKTPDTAFEIGYHVFMLYA